MTITKKVTFRAKDDSIKEMKALLKDMVKPSKAEEGCLLYGIFQFKDEPKEFLVVESWRDEEALDFHKNSKHYKRYKSNYEQFCEFKHFDDLEVL